MPTFWTARVWAEFRASTLTRTFRDVLLTLATYRGNGGDCHPSHQTLATRVGCCARTVQRALEHAQRLGLVTWCHRRARNGWRWLRTSNAYRLTLPNAPVNPSLKPVWWCRRSNGHRARGGEIEISKKAQLMQLMKEAARMPDLLALRRQVIEERLLRKKTAIGARV